MNRTFLSTLLAGVAGGFIVFILLIGLAKNRPDQLASLLPVLNLSSTGTAVPSSIDQSFLQSLGSSLQENIVIDVVKRTSPAVVSIVITKDVPVVEQYYEDVPFQSDPFNNFFNDSTSPFRLRVPRLRQQGTEKQEVGGGSGFLVSSDGLVVTNRHVVSQEGVEYTVFTQDGKTHTARIIARDPVNDIAVIKIEGTDFAYLEFGPSDQLQVGQTAIAIGNALAEFRNSVSVGVISGLSRSITAGDGLGRPEQLEEVIQTDAAINPGNSGGPLLDLKGKVVGVNVAVALGSENIGFALPSNSVISVIESVKTTGKISRPFLGVRYVLITPVVKEANRLSVDYGALVTRGETMTDLAVTPGSPADKAGIGEGDIILEADGVTLAKDTSLSSIIQRKKVGDTLRLKVLSKGATKDINVVLEDIPQ